MPCRICSLLRNRSATIHSDLLLTAAGTSVPQKMAELVHTPAEGTGIMEAQITVYDLSAPEMPIYTISVMHHTAERRGDHE